MLPEKLKALVNEFKAVQDKLKEHQLCKQQLMIQANETESVLEELQKLETDAVLYRLVGPVLVTQSPEEGLSVVQKRMEYIKKELKRVETLTDELSTQMRACAQKIEESQHQLTATAA